MDNILQLAREIGFSHFSELYMDALIVREDIRDMCITGKCRMYGNNWSCPPWCGTTQQCAERIKQYDCGILVQTTASMKDEFDYETVRETEKKHKAMFMTLARQIRLLHGNCLPLTAGACTLCRKCTCPDHPCRFPEKRYSSMEAYGLLVKDVCEASGLKYYYGPKSLTFDSCILMKRGNSV